MKLKVFENKGKFYDRLWLDYQNCRIKGGKEYDRDAVKNSFIYRYYMSKKTKAAEKLAEDRKAFDEFRNNFKRTDNKLVLLCAARLLLKKDRLSAKEYREVFELAASSEYISQECRERPDSDEAYEQLVYQLVCKYVNKIFYDNGYRQKEFDRNGAESHKVSSKDSGDKLEDIEMMYEYYLYTKSEGVYTERPAELTEEHKTLCARLYRALRETGANLGFICIPLYIDPLSGAGVYIIGDRNLGKTNSNGFGVYTTNFSILVSEADMFPDDEHEEPDCDTEVNWAYNMKKFNSVEEAFEELESEMTALEDINRFDGYLSANNLLPIEVLEKDGLEQFLIYKASASEADHLSRLTDRERKRIASVLEEEKRQKTREFSEAQKEMQRQKKQSGRHS